MFPIPPGVHWKDVVAVKAPTTEQPKLQTREPKERRKPKLQAVEKQAPRETNLASMGGLRAAAPQPDPAPAAQKTSRKREKMVAEKIDPKYLAAARELRDRWMERVNDRMVLRPTGMGKYDVTRLPGVPVREIQPMPMLLLKAG